MCENDVRNEPNIRTILLHGCRCGQLGLEPTNGHPPVTSGVPVDAGRTTAHSRVRLASLLPEPCSPWEWEGIETSNDQSVGAF